MFFTSPSEIRIEIFILDAYFYSQNDICYLLFYGFVYY